jgi:prepilin signal peptidase PulO-like enzyme (type II secretory pathway)
MDFMIIIALLIGWLAGWLVNYLADVLPTSRKINRPKCEDCQTPYKWVDYLLFRDCTKCGRNKGLRTPIVQVGMTAALVWIWIFPNRMLPFLLATILLIFLAVVMVIDLKYKLILHPVSIAGAGLGLGIGIFLRGQQSLSFGVTSTLLGGAAGFGIMLIFYFFGELFVKRMAKKRGLSPDEVALGFGDVNLSGILGLLLGWRAIFACLFFAILAGGLVSLVIILKMVISREYKAFTAIPYAPFLILSAIYFLFL